MPEYYAFTTGFIESEEELRQFRNEVEPECSGNFTIIQRTGGLAKKKQWVCSGIVCVTDGAEGVELLMLFEGYSFGTTCIDCYPPYQVVKVVPDSFG